MTKLDEILKDEGLLPIPMRKVKSLSNKNVEVWLDIHWNEPKNSGDPLRSIKEYPALLMFYEEIERAKHFRRDLKKDIFISATSGNFGIRFGLRAMSKGYKFVAVVPSSVPEYNLKIMTGLGIDVIQTEEEKTCPRDKTVFLVRQYAEDMPLFNNIDQYVHPLNLRSQTLITAKKIFANRENFREGKVDYIICPVGTGGTMSGIQQYVKDNDFKTEVIGVQPAPEQGVPGAYRVIGGDCKWSPEAFSFLSSGGAIYDADWVDSYALTTLLYGEEINAGPSTGMALSKAYKMIREEAKGTIVVISADSNLIYPDLLVERLEQTEEGILKRYPKLGLKKTIAMYIDYLKEKAGMEWIERRIKESYSPTKVGQIFPAWQIEEIGLGNIPLKVGSINF